MNKFTIGDTVKILYSKVKENTEQEGDHMENIFLRQDIAIMSNENNVFTISHIFNTAEEKNPFSLSFNGSVFADFRSDELILVKKSEVE